MMNDKPKTTRKYIYSNYSTGIRQSPIPSPRYRKPSRFRKFFFVIVLMLVIAGGGWSYLHFRHKHVITPEVAVVAHPKVQSTPAPPPVESQALDTMKDQVNAVISANPGITFEVAVTDINTGHELDFGATGPMTAASVSKLLTATDFLDQVELGDETMNETLGDGNTASYDLQQMIVVSNDNSWAALNNDLTPNQLQTYTTNLGISDFNFQNNTLSARDTANILSALYLDRLINTSDTNLLMGYLKEANYRQYILPAIPSTDTVYHKIGLYNDNVNDATIITRGNQAISLVIFTNGNGTYNWPRRAILMQDIAKPVLAYYQLN